MCKFGKTRLKSNLTRLCLLLLTTACIQDPAPTFAAHPLQRGASLTVIVKNPRCPACLKTLKGYLLEMPEVKAVSLDDMNQTGPSVKLTINLRGTASKTATVDRVLERLKARDLAVLTSKYSEGLR